METILVIEDDPHTAALVVLYLEREGFRALSAGDGPAGLAMARRESPGLVILDLMLPDMDGWEVCRRFRKTSDVPVIMLTARGEETDRVAGLTLGADYYVLKPFSPRELMARVKAVMRRAAGPQEHAPSVLVHKNVVLDLERRRLHISGEDIALTPHEFALLEAFMKAPGRIFTRDELLERLYPRGEALVVERVVDVHINKLRRKIEPEPGRPRYILTARGIGYRFADREEP
ncbi:MAG TPA: response regulator transcription factor [Desulfosarcina sp.]|nr:response regulator transcription factor [Desulfosarcina sp.]